MWISGLFGDRLASSSPLIPARAPPPKGLIDVLITGGIPPCIDGKDVAATVYRACYRRVLLQNQKFYARFPGDVGRVGAVVNYLAQQPGGGVTTPAGNLLTPRQGSGCCCLEG